MQRDIGIEIGCQNTFFAEKLLRSCFDLQQMDVIEIAVVQHDRNLHLFPVLFVEQAIRRKSPVEQTEEAL